MEKKVQKIYARQLHYNAVKLFNALSGIVTENGGDIVSSYKDELSFTDVHIRKDTICVSKEFSERISKKYQTTIDNARHIIQEHIANKCPVITTPFWVLYTCGVHFHINGFVYHISFPENMFDSITIGKIAVDENLVATKQFYCNTVSYSSELIDTLYWLNPRQQNNPTIIEEAKKLYEYMLTMPTSEYQPTKEEFIPNIYDNGYHIEKVPVKYKCKYNKIA